MASITVAIYGIQDSTNAGIVSYSHTHGFTIMRDGKVLHHLTLERFTRKKYDNDMPSQVLSLLSSLKLFDQEVDYVFVDNVLGRSFISSNGKFRFEAPLQNSLQNGIEEGRLWKFDHLEKAYALNHELAHVYSCVPFYGHFKENSLLVHYDGGASMSNFSAWHFINGEIKPLQADWKLKKYTSFYNANALSFALMNAGIFDQHSVAGKLMGYASFGYYDAKVEKWLNDLDYFQDYWGKTTQIIHEVNRFFNTTFTEIDLTAEPFQVIAFQLQHIWEQKLLERLTELKAQTQAEHLYYAGGGALNIKANALIEEKLGFKNIYIPPCAEDSGLSLGAAVAMEIRKGNQIQLHSPYLNNWQISEEPVELNQSWVEKTAELIAKGGIVGVANGTAEIGPRALGNRSLICRADDTELSVKLSTVVKGREWFRPVAPIVLRGNLEKFTDQPYCGLARYMLTEYKVNKEAVELLKGAIHVDDTARFQVLSEPSENPFMFALLKELADRHGIYALINTSFNVKGEPIVHSEEDAVRAAINMKLDGLVVQGHLYPSNEFLTLAENRNYAK